MVLNVKSVWLETDKDRQDIPPEVDNVIVGNRLRDGRQIITESVLEKLKQDKTLVPRIRLEALSDTDLIAKAATLGATDIIVTGKNDSFPVGIALEKVIAETQRYGTRLHTTVKSFEEMLAAAKTLDVGVNVLVKDLSMAKAFKDYFSPIKFELKTVPVKRLERVGACWRSCIDTGDIMTVGEGMLVGATSSAYFLVHGEVVGTEYTGRREWRCNAGAVSSYVVVDKPTGGEVKTRYLSELKCGDYALTVNRDGTARRAVVNRNKIEFRPMVKVTVESDKKEHSVLLQAERSIYLTTKDGKPLPVLDSLGQDVMMFHITGGMHFGTKIEEGIVEY